MIELDKEQNIDIIRQEASLPYKWDQNISITNVEDARVLTNKPDKGKGYTNGNNCLTQVMVNNQKVNCLLDGGAFCSVVSDKFLAKIIPDYKEHLIPMNDIKLHSCSNSLLSEGVI